MDISVYVRMIIQKKKKQKNHVRRRSLKKIKMKKKKELKRLHFDFFLSFRA